MTSMRMKALIRNIAKEKNINSGIVLRNYMLERLLERISKSNYKDNFVLKGGMLLASIVGIDLRATIDLDATLRHFPLSKEKLEKAFEDILKIEVESIRSGREFSRYFVEIDKNTVKCTASELGKA